jgi:hypothetical protein
VALRKSKDPEEKRAKRQATRATIASFAGRFGVHDDVLAMWVALMGTELHVRPERLVEALDILDGMPCLGAASKALVMREAILYLAKRLNLNAAELQAMMDRPLPKPFEPPGPAEPCPECRTMMRWAPAPMTGEPVQLCPHCHPEALELSEHQQAEA